MPDRIDAIAEALAARTPGRVPICPATRAVIRERLAALADREISAEKASRLARLWNGGSQ